MLFAPYKLREREIEAFLHLWAGVHRYAEAGAARFAAIDGDNEDALTPGAIMRIDIFASKQYAVLDGDRANLTGAHPNEREAFSRWGLWDYPNAVRLLLGAPQALAWRVKKPLP